MSKQEHIRKNSQDLLEELPSLSAEQLELLIRHHNHAYFDKNDPKITDEAFDKLVEALRFLDQDSFVLQEIESGLMSAPVENIVMHARPMLSLDKCYDDDSFTKWREKIRGSLIAMPKIDGVACSIHYNKKGELFLAATRGDGKKGENITENVKCIEDVPHPIKTNTEVEIRGEVYMKLSLFCAHYKDKFANPRNLAAGALKQKQVVKSAAYQLSFFPYDIDGLNLKTEEDKFAKLQELGFKCPDVRAADDLNECKKIYLQLAQQRHSLDFEIDGVVFRSNQVSEQNRLGITAHHPKWTIAYKFQGESAQTHLVDVEWSIARTGVITPVAIVKPVFVSGATVTRASLHNLGMFQKQHLSKNALVEIVRRGGVIPHLERVLRSSEDRFLIPTQCPSCCGPVKIEGDFLCCLNPEACLRVVRAKIEHFCAVLDIEGFGEKLIQALIQEKLVKGPADLYRLQIGDLLRLERMGKTLAAKLLKKVETKREVDLALFVTALGIPEVGPTIAETIVQHYPTLDKLKNATEEQIALIYGIGTSIAEALVQGLKAYEQDIKELLKEIKIVEQQMQKVNYLHPLAEKSVVFTGTMQRLERKEAQKQVRLRGGKTPSLVTSETDYLVFGDKKEANEISSKQKKANKLVEQGSQIKIISESDFLEMLK